MSNKNEYKTSERKRKVLGVFVFIILMIFTSAAVYFLSEDTLSFNFKNKTSEKKDNKEDKKVKNKKDVTDKGSIKDIVSITEEVTTTINGISVEAQVVPDAEGFDLYINDKLVETSEGNIDIAPYKDILVIGIKNGETESSDNNILFVDRFGNIIYQITDINDHLKLFDVHINNEYKMFSLDEDNVYFNASAISDGKIIDDDYSVKCDDVVSGKYYISYKDEKFTKVKSYYEEKAKDSNNLLESCDE